ncbi:MAG: MoxR family ATPase [Fimbriiglobus sp.]|nr:MoxR family ATPase [Fimbriiglobus sp.]
MTAFPDVPASSVATLSVLRSALNVALRGKPEVIERVLACLLARGHVLLEDRPGLGKTTLAKALAAAVGGVFSRVQCTPDLLPGDITGFSVFNQKTREFEFQPGPVFADVLLADEINRTTPRTQSALLEAMAERQVTVDNVRHKLHDGFFVIATQNPIDHHGTYPLPEAQLDRFAMKLSIGYPDKQNERDMLSAAVGKPDGRDELPRQAVMPAVLVGLQEQVAAVAVASAVQDYLIDLATAVRNHPKVPHGLSPRGLLTWQRVAQAWAFLAGRPFVTPDDVKLVAQPVLCVRFGPNVPTDVIPSVLSTVPVPVYPR